MQRQRALLLGLVGCALARLTAATEVMKGIAYGPVPLKTLSGTILNDDFMTDEAKPLWGIRGRGDLAMMKGLGANTVRLYGNDPANDHTSFLDEAHRIDMKVIVGQSDFPFTQSADRCQLTQYNCYNQIYSSYLQNLQKGFLQSDGTYHPALSHVIIINEPDLKFPGITQPILWSRGIVSAVDAMLDAEKAAGLSAASALVNFTVAFSFGICFQCRVPSGIGSTTQKPGLGQMIELRDAFLNPQDYGYTPKNNLAEFYRTRFTNSFNTQNPIANVRLQFLDLYHELFVTTPIFIGEYHAPHRADINVSKDLTELLEYTANSSLMQGVSFFEYQVRYDKGGAETEFGIFGLGNYEITKFQFFAENFSVWCLDPVADRYTGVGGGLTTLPAEVAVAFGGTPDFSKLCIANPNSVELSTSGFSDITAQSDASRMAVFVDRLVQHMGGKTTSTTGLQTFAASASTYNSTVTALEQQPSWATWDTYAACVADREASGAEVGLALQQNCLASWFNCSNIPVECSNTWLRADYVFSTFYLEAEKTNSAIKPLTGCDYNGAGIFAVSSTYRGSYGDTTCVVTKDPVTTPVTDEGYEAIRRLQDVDKNILFIRRIVDTLGGASVDDENSLRDFAQTWLTNPPASMTDVKRILRVEALWVCGGTTSRICTGFGETSIDKADETSWIKWGFLAVACIMVACAISVCLYVRTCKRSCEEWSARRTAEQQARKLARKNKMKWAPGSRAPPSATQASQGSSYGDMASV